MIQRRENRGSGEARAEDGARSYRGVLSNGVESHSQKNKDSAGYIVKGKGKKYEEYEAKRVQGSDRSSRRSYTDHKSRREEEGVPRNRQFRRPQERGEEQEAQRWSQRRDRSVRSPSRPRTDEQREEGEIMVMDRNVQVLQEEEDRNLVSVTDPIGQGAALNREISSS
ncbi:unnamed protein product, partial [Eruca vesicaria subsp. sativa]|nr:unnamed protein product [Eruca vesicaria subsp. sativa]